MKKRILRIAESLIKILYITKSLSTLLLPAIIGRCLSDTRMYQEWFSS